MHLIEPVEPPLSRSQRDVLAKQVEAIADAVEALEPPDELIAAVEQVQDMLDDLVERLEGER